MPAVLKTKFKPCDVSKAKVRPAGDISSAFNSFSGSTQDIDEALVSVKRELIKDPEALKRSWLRLKVALAQGIQEIKEKGSNIVPQVDFNDLAKPDEDTRNEIKIRGCAVIKNVVPKEEAKKMKEDLIEYVAANPQTKGFPKDKKVVYELYWSKSQIRARSHPRLRASQKFMNKLWHAEADSEIELGQNVMYADRLRMRQPGDALFALGPHADGGSIERWEDVEYRQCYTPIFEGRWEEFDPYDATHRVGVDMTKYDSNGNCNVFRSFQGWLAISEIAPKEGTILFAPLIKEVTAYWMLKPFFDENDNLRMNKEFPGAFPGKGQEFSDETHPELRLSDVMVSIPKVEPGDMVYWHCDCIHSVDPTHQGSHDSSVLYIPATPLCDINVKYVWLQRESFLRGLAPPDFPGFPLEEAETNHNGRASVQDVEDAGGPSALQDFALSPFDHISHSKGSISIVNQANELMFEGVH